MTPAQKWLAEFHSNLGMVLDHAKIIENELVTRRNKLRAVGRKNYRKNGLISTLLGLQVLGSKGSHHLVNHVTDIVDRKMVLQPETNPTYVITADEYKQIMAGVAQELIKGNESNAKG